MGFVIYLSTSRMGDSGIELSFNDYGYWQGKKFVVQGQEYPITDREITEETKVFSSRVRAEKSAEKAYNKFGFVSFWRVEEI